MGTMRNRKITVDQIVSRQTQVDKGIASVTSLLTKTSLIGIVCFEKITGY